MGNYFISLKGKNHFDQFDTVTKLHQVRVTENFRLPIFYGNSTDYESVTKPYKYTKEGAEKKAQEQLELLLETLRKKEVQIKENNVKIQVLDKVCVAKGRLTIIEKTTEKEPVEILEQPVQNAEETEE